VLQQGYAAHADIAATYDQHARTAEVSGRFHGARIVAVKRGGHRATIPLVRAIPVFRAPPLR
jgi:hypothetical protein